MGLVSIQPVFAAAGLEASAPAGASIVITVLGSPLNP
jgi:hypothetical protein